MNNKKIAIIGGGNMGIALAKGILQTTWAAPEHIMVAEPLKARFEHIKVLVPGVKVSHSNIEAAQFADIIILSVKPQILLKVVDEIKPALKDSKLLISVAAGLTTSEMEKKSGGKVHVVRAMPNIAAVVREAATAICPGEYATETDMAAAQHIFESVGIVVEVEEVLMDAVTGLSGTGPMYVFQILEGLSDAGVKVGLSRDIANTLAVQTLIGSSKLIQETKEHPAKLKDLVTSPGGTAISALHSLERNGLKAMLIDAVEIASLRSAELGLKRKDKSSE
ncbi:MAG: pyrroline-5-carboxylate reductase [Thermoplasmata archaeon]|nr:pyrroline-5-carboxylate reductase [Thermoplasmata archaeon]